MKINRHILDNGLRLVHSQDESTQMVALNILYNVGARDKAVHIHFQVCIFRA